MDRLEQRALTELSISPGLRSREVPKAEQRQESKAVPPQEQGLPQPTAEVLSQTTPRAQGWNNPARQEQRAMAAFIQTSTAVNPSLLCAPKWICFAEMKY